MDLLILFGFDLDLLIDRKETFNDEKVKMITAASNLIKSEIRCIRYEANFYPPKAGIELVTELLRPSLKLLTKFLMGQE